MKILKILLIIITLAAITLAAGCTPTVPPLPPVETQGTIAEFFPFHENTLIVFERSDVFGSDTSFTIATEGDRMQRITTLGQFQAIEVFEISGGELRVNHASITASVAEPLLDRIDDNPMIILQEPLVLGHSWETHTGPTIQGVARGVTTITAVDVEIETPYGTVVAIEVATEFENGYWEVNYFAKGLGLVQSGYFIQGFEQEREAGRFFQEDMTVDRTLRSITENSVFDMEFIVIHPNDNADELDFSESSFSISTNGNHMEALRAAFESTLRNPGNRPHGVISLNTVINSININREETNVAPFFESASVHLDLSGSFSEDMTVGISYEQLILTSLEMTFLEFFNAQEFILTVDGQPHVSIH